jgi:hypothetical protein
MKIKTLTSANEICERTSKIYTDVIIWNIIIDNNSRLDSEIILVILWEKRKRLKFYTWREGEDYEES